MIIKISKTILIIVLSTLVTVMWASQSPYDVVHNHLKYLEPEDKNVKQSALSFHPDIPRSERMKMAENLKQILDANGIYISVGLIPRNPEYIDSISGMEIYHLIKDVFPSITIEKYGNNWYYSKEMAQVIPKLFKRTFPSWSLELVNGVPDSMKATILGVELWKLLGLFLLIIVAFLAYKLIKWFVDRFMENTIWSRLRISEHHHPKLQELARWFGALAVLMVVNYLLPLLMLEIHYSRPIFKVLKVVTNVVMMMIVLKIITLIQLYLKNIVRLTSSKVDDQIMPIASKLAKIGAVTFFVIRILLALDVNVTALIAGVSIGGLAVALAAQDTVKNFIGSLMIIFDRPFMVGDYVIGGGIEGTVEEVGFRSSKIRKIDTSLITVPNNTLTNASMENLGVRHYRIFDMNIGLTYDTDAAILKAISNDLRTMCESYDKIQPDTSLVYLRYLSASSIDIYFRVYIMAADFKEELTIREDLIYLIMDIVKQHGASFAFPSQSLYIEKK